MGHSDCGRQQTNLFWAEIYAQLSEFFKEPSESFADDVASGRLAKFFNERLSLLGLDPSLSQGLSRSGDVCSELGREYQRVFLGPLPPYIVPVESIYKKWTSDSSCHLPLASEKGYLMGDPALDMMRRYRDEDMAIPEALLSMPDHVALELEYMAYLLKQKDEAACREYLFAHLDWLGDLVRDIEDAGMGSFYTCGARITRNMIDIHFK